MSIFYIEDKNGTYLSEDRQRKFIRLQGKEAYEYLKSADGKGKRFLQTETEETGGEKVYVEIPKEYISIYRKEERHDQYTANCEKNSQIKTLSLYQPLTDNEDLFLEDIIADSLKSIEDEALHEIELEILRRALKTLSDDELKIIHALYLSDNPIAESRLSKELHIPRTTLIYRKKQIFEKLKKFFE